MNKLLFCFTGLFLFTLLTPLAFTAETAPPTDNELLSLALYHSNKDGIYTVVAPRTSMGYGSISNPQELAQRKKYIRENLKLSGYDPAMLIDVLFERNKEPVLLTLPSAPEKGYWIDYDSRFAGYFKTDGGGWQKWYRENPQARGWTQISLPAYDPQSGIVLFYSGGQYNYLAGAGYIIAYRYQDGALTELARVMMWIS
jgi:hypothetical protein